MKKLISQIEKLKKSNISELVEMRMREFARKRKNSEDIFSELCFCILTANYSAEGGIRIQKALHKEFHDLSESQLASKLRSLGHRFPNLRAKFIYKAREHKGKLGEILCSCNSFEMREWLAKNILGIGYKEASHFLRNIGITDLAIIDFHIIDLLERYGLIEKPKSKSLTKKKYLEIEDLLAKVARKAGISLAELDLYLWYMETGKILK
jgi:N-glycosylase/DNA lyase